MAEIVGGVLTPSTSPKSLFWKRPSMVMPLSPSGLEQDTKSATLTTEEKETAKTSAEDTYEKGKKRTSFFLRNDTSRSRSGRSSKSPSTSSSRVGPEEATSDCLSPSNSRRSSQNLSSRSSRVMDQAPFPGETIEVARSPSPTHTSSSPTRAISVGSGTKREKSSPSASAYSKQLAPTGHSPTSSLPTREFRPQPLPNIKIHQHNPTVGEIKIAYQVPAKLQLVAEEEASSLTLTPEIGSATATERSKDDFGDAKPPPDDVSEPLSASSERSQNSPYASVRRKSAWI